ncbi:MAG: phosphodiester glycosidase family protein [Clostridiales bacterium]|nr:phosphodiester glycosidase family protein [Clostridiales bacterium]
MTRSQKITLTIVLDFVLLLLLGGLVCAFTFGWFEQDIETPPIILDTPLPSPTPDVLVAEIPTPTPGTEETPELPVAPTSTPVIDFPGILDAKYRDYFLPEGTAPIWTETTYQSSDVYIKMDVHEEKHLKYWVADIYVRNVENLKADYVSREKDKMTIPKFHAKLDAMLTINTDYWINPKSRHGWFVRNGEEIARNPEKALSNDFCVIYRDGTMETYDYNAFLASFAEGDISFDTITARFPYHVFYFGPALLDDQGYARTKFNTASQIGGKNPRTAIGYYEPGHYAFICVLGPRNVRNKNFQVVGSGKSDGLSLIELAALCESLGMKAAYNLDGGSTTAMMFGDNLYGHHDRTLPDVLSIVEFGG